MGETTKERRDWLRRNWNPGGLGFRDWVAGSDEAHRLVPLLCNDSDLAEDLEAENERLWAALLKYGDHISQNCAPMYGCSCGYFDALEGKDARR